MEGFKISQVEVLESLRSCFIEDTETQVKAKYLIRMMEQKSLHKLS